MSRGASGERGEELSCWAEEGGNGIPSELPGSLLLVLLLPGWLLLLLPLLLLLLPLLLLPLLLLPTERAR